MVQLSHPYVTTGRTITFTIQTFVGKVMPLLFNMLSRFVIGCLPRSQCLLTLWLQSLSTEIFEPKKIKSVTVSTFSPSICHEVMILDAMILVFWMLSFKPAFSLSSFTLIKRLFRQKGKDIYLQRQENTQRNQRVAMNSPVIFLSESRCLEWLRNRTYKSTDLRSYTQYRHLATLIDS